MKKETIMKGIVILFVLVVVLVFFSASSSNPVENVQLLPASESELEQNSRVDEMIAHNQRALSAYSEQSPFSFEISEWQTYTSESASFEFRYPAVLVELEELEGDGDVMISRDIPFEHYDYCDLSGLGEKETSIPDFELGISVTEMSFRDSAVSNGWWESNFSESGELVAGTNVAKEFYVADYLGYQFFLGSEGCGGFESYIPLGQATTLIVWEPFPLDSLGAAGGLEISDDFLAAQAEQFPIDNTLLVEQILSTFRLTQV